jgi:DNA-binding NtrC family response regulator
VRSFDAEARRRLLAHTFPGNVRELKAVVELATVLADGSHIRASDLPALQTTSIGRETAPVVAVATAATAATATPNGHQPSLREQTLAIMQNALIHTQGDVVAAAGRLRVGRSTLYRLLQSGHLRLP